MDKFLYLISEGLKNVWRHKMTTFTAVFSLFLALYFVGLLATAGENTKSILQYLRSKYKIEVFFKQNVDIKVANDVSDLILEIKGVRSSTVINKDDAVRIFKDQFGEDILGILGYNPLPISAVVNLKRNSEELLAYIDKKLERNIELMIPRSNVASKDLVLGLEKLGFKTNSWIGYDNISKAMSSFDVQSNDVLLLSSPSSARAWVENSLPIPKNILCMGKSSLEEIDSLGYFSSATVEILKGPTAEFVANWWNRKRGD